MSEDITQEVQDLIEEHGMHLFEDKSSNYVDENGEEKDHSFATESGRVYYEKQENNFKVFLVPHGQVLSDVNVYREMNLDLLTKWFYCPTDKFFSENIDSIAIKG